VWTLKCEEAFHTLWTLLTSTPVLAQSDIEKPFDVYCDASGTGLGCVLMQEGRVCNTPGVRLAFLALELHEPMHHLFIYEHGTYVMH
jgi:hypothetical protein